MIQTIIIILFILASDTALYFLITKKLSKREAPVETKQEKAVVETKATNAERLFQEGIQSILSYDANVMKQYLKGVEDE